MYVLNVTDYDNMTDDYNDSLSKNKNCTNNGNNIDIIIPAIFFFKNLWSIFLCLMGLKLYFLIKPFLRQNYDNS